jgi:hypothetical protein
MNWKGYGTKILSWHLHGETKEIMKRLSEDSCCPSQDLNPGPPEYEAGVGLWY